MDRLGRPSLPARLERPDRLLSLDELAASWLTVRIEAVLPGYAPFAGDLDMMRKIRGALGAVLVRSASQEARAGRPCTWQPPCPLDVLFREQVRLGGRHGLPKPWVLACDRAAHDLVASISLFGMAADWAPAVASALADALQHGMNWNSIQPGVFRPAPVVSIIRIVERQGIASGPTGTATEIVLLTPLDAEGVDARERPDSVLARMARRVDLMARWQDAALDTHWQALADSWHGLEYDVVNLVPLDVPRRAGRGRHGFAQPMLTGSLTVMGDLGLLGPLLRLAELSHVGRGATAGFGRVAVRGLGPLG